jgi:hypothetical protein
VISEITDHSPGNTQDATTAEKATSANLSSLRPRLPRNTLEVWLSDGRIIVTPLSWYPTLQAATAKQRRAFENRGVGLTWEELDLDLSVEGMLAGNKEFVKKSHVAA